MIVVEHRGPLRPPRRARPSTGVGMVLPAGLEAPPATAPTSLLGVLVQAVPTSSFEAMARGAITFRCTHYIMWIAPAAVFAALAGTIAANGATAMAGLTRLVAAAWAAEVLFRSGCSARACCGWACRCAAS